MIPRLPQPNLSFSSRRRGGVLFTMIIFIMMLTSTGLMYYYFQRARHLEQELHAIRGTPAPSAHATGTIKVGDSQYRLASWDDEDKGSRPSAAPPQADRVTLEATPESNTEDPPSPPASTPAVAAQPETSQAPSTPVPNANEAEEPTGSVPQETPAPRRQAEAAPASPTLEPTNPPRATPSGPIQSIYDIQSASPEEPKVRVRTPKRDL